MCSAHIFKVAYMCLYALICAVLTLLNAATNSTAEKACQARKSSFLRWARTQRT